MIMSLFLLLRFSKTSTSTCLFLMLFCVVQSSRDYNKFVVIALVLLFLLIAWACCLFFFFITIFFLYVFVYWGTFTLLTLGLYKEAPRMSTAQEAAMPYHISFFTGGFTPPSSAQWSCHAYKVF
jgi:hypothetical protein